MLSKEDYLKEIERDFEYYTQEEREEIIQESFDTLKKKNATLTFLGLKIFMLRFCVLKISRLKKIFLTINLMVRKGFEMNILQIIAIQRQ